MKYIYVFYGAKGSGKDTCYGIFSSKVTNSCKLSFADKLKSTCWYLFKRKLKDSERLYGAIDRKEEPIEGWYIPDKIKEECGFNETLWTGRRLIQWFGTEVCRGVYDDIWIDLLMEELDNQYSKYICITDCRFLNEYKALKELDPEMYTVKFFHVNRATEENEYSGHASEKDLQFFEPDVLIDNTGTFKELEEQVELLINN